MILLILLGIFIGLLAFFNILILKAYKDFKDLETFIEKWENGELDIKVPIKKRKNPYDPKTFKIIKK